MWQADDILVISDLHLAPERGRGLFQADDKLADFLRWVVAEVAGPAQLVIDGDFLDFLVPAADEDVPAFDPVAAPARARRILDHHEEVCDALTEIVRSPDHQLVLLAGNHDPELILPAVQEVVERRLGAAAGGGGVRWLVQREAARFRVGAAEVSIEHGDLFDDWNRIDRDDLNRALNRISRGFVEEHGFEAPPGSHLVVRFTTRLRQRFPWIDYLKPEREAVQPLLDHLLPLEEKTLLLEAIGPWLRFKANALESLGLSLGQPHHFVRGPAAENRRRRFAEWWRQKMEQARQRVREVRRDQLIAELREVSAEDGYFDLRHPDDPSDQVARFLDHGTDLILMGHTHAAKALPLGDRGLYLNTGTWGRLLALPESGASPQDWERFLEGLEAGRQEDFVRPTFARVRREESNGETCAQLLEWSAAGPQPLAGFRFERRDRTWIEEA